MSAQVYNNIIYCYYSQKKENLDWILSPPKDCQTLGTTLDGVCQYVSSRRPRRSVLYFCFHSLLRNSASSSIPSRTCSSLPKCPLPKTMPLPWFIFLLTLSSSSSLSSVEYSSSSSNLLGAVAFQSSQGVWHYLLVLRVFNWQIYA